MKEELSYEGIKPTKEAWDELREFFKGTKGFVPPPGLGEAAIARNPDGKIVSALVIQLCPYMGPLKTEEGYQGHVDFRQLKEIIDNNFSKGMKESLIIQGYIVLTSDERIAKLAEFNGMTRIHPKVLIQNLEAKDGVPV
jgi:hypothetical protein